MAKQPPIGTLSESEANFVRAGNNPYDVLGLQQDASNQDLKKSYRNMAMQYHPDKNNNSEEATEKFKKIEAAYGILKEQDKRISLDNYLNDQNKAADDTRLSTQVATPGPSPKTAADINSAATPSPTPTAETTEEKAPAPKKGKKTQKAAQPKKEDGDFFEVDKSQPAEVQLMQMLLQIMWDIQKYAYDKIANSVKNLGSKNQKEPSKSKANEEASEKDEPSEASEDLPALAASNNKDNSLTESPLALEAAPTTDSQPAPNQLLLMSADYDKKVDAYNGKPASDIAESEEAQKGITMAMGG